MCHTIIQNKHIFSSKMCILLTFFCSNMMQNTLQREVFRIQATESWQEFFKGIQLPCPSKREMVQMLLTALQNSAMKGYHGGRR